MVFGGMGLQIRPWHGIFVLAAALSTLVAMEVLKDVTLFAHTRPLEATLTPSPLSPLLSSSMQSSLIFGDDSAEALISVAPENPLDETEPLAINASGSGGMQPTKTRPSSTDDNRRRAGGELPGLSTHRTFWKPGEAWGSAESLSPRNNFKIAVINVWLGRSIPEHMVQSIETFSRNDGTHYILFTDPSYLVSLKEQLSHLNQTTVHSHYKIKGQAVSLKEYIHHQFWQRTRGVTQEPAAYSYDFAHNLCDYRPLYGLIFGEFIRQYSHWAWTDKDTFIGDLSQHITAYDLAQAEIIGIGGTKHGAKVMLSTYGQLAIFQNSERVNKAMLLDRDLLIKQFKNLGRNSGNTDEYAFNKHVLAGQGRDGVRPPLKLLYIVYGVRKRHATLVKTRVETEPYKLIATSTCFAGKPDEGGAVKLCRKPDDREGWHAMQMFRTTFEQYEGGTARVPTAEIECCGWWMGKNLLPKHTGFFKFYRGADGGWWKRRAFEQSPGFIRMINAKGGTGDRKRVIQWKRAILTHARQRVCVIPESEQESWIPGRHECTNLK